MLNAAAEAAGAGRGLLVDLGIGTGALSERCRARGRGRALVGIDADEAMLRLARLRLGPAPKFVTGDFTRVALPRATAIVASLALHHVPTPRAKLALYRRCRGALAQGGRLVIADCCPATDVALARAQFAAWRAHMRLSFSASETERWFRRWRREDFYLPLATELALLIRAGFTADVVWRAGCFAVIAASA
jgi:SAM-dependent methyltransferase